MFRNPDFLIVGAQKAGTTSLHSYLSCHPDIVLHDVKEYHFFDLHYKNGIDWYRSMFPFEHGKLTGEATPYYLFHPSVPSRVRQHLPDVKLIILLRNPVDRAYSHFRHSMFLSLEKGLTFEMAIEQEPHRLKNAEELLYRGEIERHFSFQHHSYLSRGFYSKQIQRWLDLFPAEQFLFIQSEKLFASPKEQLDRVYQFLDIPPFALNEYPIFNEGQYEAPLDASLRAKLMDLFRDDIAQTEHYTGLKFDWDVSPSSRSDSPPTKDDSDQ